MYRFEIVSRLGETPVKVKGPWEELPDDMQTELDEDDCITFDNYDDAKVRVGQYNVRLGKGGV